LAITATGIELHEGKQTTTLHAGGLALSGDHEATATLSTVNGAFLAMSSGDKRAANLAISGEQSTFSIAHAQNKVFIAASDTSTAVDATSALATAGLYVRSGDASDANVTASVGDKTVSLAATKTKADVDHAIH